MKLENQCCTLEQAKRIVDLGIQVDPAEDEFGIAFWWHYDTHKWKLLPEGFFDPFEEGVEYYPAFTVAELGVMLPWQLGLQTPVVNIEFKILGIHPPWSECSEWQAGYIEVEEGYEYGAWLDMSSGSTEAEARAALLVYLLETKSITAAEVNERLANA